MKEIYPEFSDKVDFYAIGQSQFETIDQLEDDRIKHGYPWRIAKMNQDLLKELRVLQQSTKIAVDHQGIVSYSAGYGDGDINKWRQVFFNLVERSAGRAG